MNDSEFSYVLAALQFKFGYGIGVACWITSLRVVMVFVNSKLKEFAENSLPADKEWIDGLLNARWYRLSCFLLNAVASVKLPTRIGKPGPPSSANGGGASVPASQ